MKTWLLQFWHQLRTSYWFVPSLLMLAALLLAFGMVALDEKIKSDGLILPALVYQGGADGARAVLSTVAGSMISVTGITFSITIVALTLASSQFGPRLLRNFMRDTGNQVVLGVFLATFVYCLLVLRQVEGPLEPIFVPHLSVSLGVVLALGSMGVLIYFIHHVAQNIQAENVISDVGADLDAAIERLYPEMISAKISDETTPPAQQLPPNFHKEALPVHAHRFGYIQAVDADGLMRTAKEHDVVLRMNHKPGDYVLPDAVLVEVWPPDRADDKLSDRINSVFYLANQRTGEQDAEFGAHQLVEIALRALSSGINDPFTAINCIDRLGASVTKLTSRVIPSGFRYDEEQRLRIVTEVDHFQEILDAAFDQIRQSARTNAAVTIRLLEIITEIAHQTHRPTDRAALLRQAQMVERGSRTGLPEEEDLKEVRARYQVALEALHCFPGPSNSEKKASNESGS